MGSRPKYKYCDAAKEELFKFLDQVWEQDLLPEDFAQAKFVIPGYVIQE